MFRPINILDIYGTGRLEYEVDQILIVSVVRRLTRVFTAQEAPEDTSRPNTLLFIMHHIPGPCRMEKGSHSQDASD